MQNQVVSFSLTPSGRGRAQRFAGPEIMKNAESISKAIRSLCFDHVAERIEGIEIRPRNVGGNPVVAVRIPVSGRRPHMVTLNHGTSFMIRVEDGKREMSLGEIRDAFVNTPMGLRLDSIDARITDLFRALTRGGEKEELTEALETGISDAILRAEDGTVVADVMRERFEGEVGNRPYLWLGATAVAPRRHLVEVDEPEIAAVVSQPPGSRPNGWNMGGLDFQRRRSINGIELGAKKYKYLGVYENGHLEFWTAIGEAFCWRQSVEERRIRPRLYPYAVVEYPVSFLRLASAVFNRAGYAGEVVIQLQYRNIAGSILRSGRPEQIDFESPLVPSTPFPEMHLRVGPKRVAGGWNPHQEAFDLLKSVYLGFGIGVDGIPFRNADGTFSFGS